MEDPFDLVIDAGNTRTKIGWARNGRIERWRTVDRIGAELLKELSDEEFRSVVIGSVGSPQDGSISVLERKAPVLNISGSTPLPIGNDYSTPATLGVDRIANAVGAWRMFPDRPVLVIDAGTCITYDLVENGRFAGGAISPGRQMRAKAMHAYSARLPLVGPVEDAPLLGRSTEEALASGVQHGMINEIRGMIEGFRHQRNDMAVILTGGDALAAARALKSGIFAHPLLTLEGSYAILLHVREAHGFGRAGTHRGPGPGAAG